MCTKEYINEDLKNKSLFELNIKDSIPNRYIGYATLNNHINSFSTSKLIEIIEKDLTNC